jgi:uncharacterized protein YecE (DUF72 family)
MTGLGVHPSFFSSALMAQQLPPLAKYSGESQEVGETFRDWLDQFEMVAAVCHWTENAKLVNLTTRLRGQAYAFYRSCPAPQKASYPILVRELTKRFTPVRLQAVQSNLFLRKQGPKETVDTYAQNSLVRILPGQTTERSSSTSMRTAGKKLQAWPVLYVWLHGTHCPKLSVASKPSTGRS